MRLTEKEKSVIRVAIADELEKWQEWNEGELKLFTQDIKAIKRAERKIFNK